MKKFSIVAKDVHSPLVRNEIWTHLADIWPTVFRIPRPQIGIVSRKNTIEYVLELSSWSEARAVLGRRIEDNPEELASLIERSEEWGKEMNAFTQKIHEANLAIWTTEALNTAYRNFADLQARQYSAGALLPLLDIGGESFIESFVKEMINERLEELERVEAFTVLTTPLKESFSLEQEKDLWKLARQVAAYEGAKKIIIEKSPVEAWKQLVFIPDVAEMIRAHTKKHGWVYYVYAGPAFDEVRFVEFLQDLFIRKVDPVKKELELHAEQKKLHEDQEALIQRLAKTTFEKRLLSLASEYVWSKPRRKDYQSRSYFHMESFYREWARRTGVSLRHARSATMAQIKAALEGQSIRLEDLEAQYREHVITNENEGVHLRFGKEAQVFIDECVERAYVQNPQGVEELQGSTAYPGRVRGRVRLVNTPEDMQHFSPGEILVAIATTPSIVPAMKKAAAILTDEGGLTCHAAIVSRELKVPCIVGLKIVTSVLKDGDEVEVDAEKALVKRIQGS